MVLQELPKAIHSRGWSVWIVTIKILFQDSRQGNHAFVPAISDFFYLLLPFNKISSVGTPILHCCFIPTHAHIYTL